MTFMKNRYALTVPLLCMALTLFLMAGCSSFTTKSGINVIDPPYSIEPQPGMASVSFYCLSTVCFCNSFNYVYEGEDIYNKANKVGAVVKNGYFTLHYEPGIHVFTTSKTDGVDSVTMNLEAGEKYFVKVGSDCTNFICSPIMRQVDEKFALKEMEGLKQIALK
jgi:hypothetical protein